MKRALAFVALLAWLPRLQAGESAPWPLEFETEGDPASFSIYFENDLFARTDNNYTNGVKLVWTSPQLPDELETRSTARLAAWVMDQLPWIDDRKVRDRHVAFSIGQNLYTPLDLTRTDLIEDDRPYAAWLYTGVALHHRSDAWLDTLELTVGVVGPWAMGEEAQNLVHRLKDIPLAMGWDNQVQNEPALNLVWERKWRHPLWGQAERFSLEGHRHVGFALGNVFTYANLGFGLRAGWNLTPDYGAAVIRPTGDASVPYRRGGDPISFFYFTGVDSRAVARDITLDGNTFRPSHRVEKELFVSDFVSGISVVYGAWKLSYLQIVRTPQFEGGGQHAFGSINLMLTY